MLRLANHHLVTPALAWSVRDAPEIPTDAREFLDAILTLNRDRNRVLVDTLVSVLETWQPRGIPSLLLKGTASLASGLYPDPGMRILQDIDILVPADRAHEAVRLLIDEGFVPTHPEVDYSGHHHLVPQRHPVTGIPVEVHHHVLKSDHSAVIPVEAAWRDARPCVVGGFATHTMGTTTRFAHAVVHAQLQHDGHPLRTFRLRDMLELAMLASFRQEPIEWTHLIQMFPAPESFAVLQEVSDVLVRLFGVDRPDAIPAPQYDPLRSTRRRLERRTDWPGYLIAYYLRHYHRLIVERPTHLLNVCRPARLANHLSWILTTWRSRAL